MMGLPRLAQPIERRWATLGAYVLLCMLWAMLVFGARHLSLSMDEPAHIAGGYVFLARWPHALWYIPMRMPPPLLNAAEGLLFFLSKPDIPLETLPGWGQDFPVVFTPSLLPYMLPLERTEVLARTPMVMLTVLLGALVFRWGKRLGGAAVGLFALGLLTFDPLMLANGRLANTDTGVAAIGTAALYVGWRWLDRPLWRRALACGALLGLTVLAKFSGIVWIVAWGLIALWAIVKRWSQEGRTRLLQSVGAGLVAMLIVWATFGFSVGITPVAPFALPAPEYWLGLQNQQDTTIQRIFVAFGQTWFGSQWWYFPLNILIKNPLPLLAVCAAGIWLFIRHSRRNMHVLALAVFPLVYTLTSIAQGMNVSYRHLLPVHPFMYLMAAVGLGSWLSRMRQQRRDGPRQAWLTVCGVGAVLGVWYIVGTWLIYPNEQTFSNELVGGPDNGCRYLVDFTCDWGQAYKQLGTFLQTHPGPEPQVVHFTAALPDLYGITFRSLWPSGGAQAKSAPFRPQPGRYVMGDAPLYGLVGPDPQQLDWFRRARPTAAIGHSLFVYDVTTWPEWVAQCASPIAPLDEVALAQGLGRADVRRVDLDCRTTWLYPRGQGTGLYVLHHDLLQEQGSCGLLRCDPVPIQPFIARHTERANARLAYEQRYASVLPAFAIYEQESFALPALLRQVYAAAASTSPASRANTPALTAPLVMDGPLAFLGARSLPYRDALEIETWWRVTQTPITRPLSIMAHLVTEQGESLGVADGLGISPLSLVTGDVIVQRHLFPLPKDKRIWLRTGAYWSDSVTRWGITPSPGSDALFMSIEIRP